MVGSPGLPKPSPSRSRKYRLFAATPPSAPSIRPSQSLSIVSQSSTLPGKLSGFVSSQSPSRSVTSGQAAAGSPAWRTTLLQVTSRVSTTTRRPY
jgi:hypothetical protein